MLIDVLVMVRSVDPGYFIDLGQGRWKRSSDGPLKMPKGSFTPRRWNDPAFSSAVGDRRRCCPSSLVDGRESKISWNRPPVSHILSLPLKTCLKFAVVTLHALLTRNLFATAKFLVVFLLQFHSSFNFLHLLYISCVAFAAVH